MLIRQWKRFPLLFLLVVAAGCEDGTEPSRPASIEIGGDDVSGPAGVSLTSPPTFLIRDQHGAPFGGVGVTITVLSGGGSVAGTPLQSEDGPVAIGVWTLGAKAGLNELLLTIEGLDPVRIRATGVPGAPGKLTPVTAQTFAGRVATAVDPLPRALLTDLFDNPLPGVTVSVTTSGGSAPASLTSAADGTVAVPEWILGTVRGPQALTMTAGSAGVTFNAIARSGAPASLSVVSGGSQSARAGTRLPQPVRLIVRDDYGNPVDSTSVAFAVVEGGGTISSASASTDESGTATVPGWTLGVRAVPQRIRATVGSLGSDVIASVATEYDIDVRFFGPPMSARRQAAFTGAAQRLSAIIVGDLPEVQATATDVSKGCGATGVAPLNEVIDDVVIFAGIVPIDGPNHILGQAGPCYVRSGSNPTVIGIMEFDEADVSAMEESRTFEGVIMHEMLHVLGIGTSGSWYTNLIGRGTVNTGFTGPGARDACIEIIGARCNVSVPVENEGGAGTRDAHWRESVFTNELMTGFVNQGGMPLSLMTIGALGDIGYTVNYAAADPFPGTIAGARLPGGGNAHSHGWERVLPPAREISRSGRITEIQ